MTKLKPNWRPVSEITPDMEYKTLLLCITEDNISKLGIGIYKKDFFTDGYKFYAIDSKEEIDTWETPFCERNVTHFAPFEDIELPEEDKNDR